MSSQPSHFSLEGHLIAKHTLSEETKKLLHTLSLEKKLAKLTAIKVKIQVQDMDIIEGLAVKSVRNM